MATEGRHWNTPPAVVAAAALVHGLIAAVITAAVIWLIGQGAEGPVPPPWDAYLVIAFTVGAMGGAVWSRRPGEPRQGIFR